MNNLVEISILFNTYLSRKYEAIAFGKIGIKTIAFVIKAFEVVDRFGIGVENVTHHHAPRLFRKKTDHLEFAIFVILEIGFDHRNF